MGAGADDRLELSGKPLNWTLQRSKILAPIDRRIELPSLFYTRFRRSLAALASKHMVHVRLLGPRLDHVLAHKWQRERASSCENFQNRIDSIDYEAPEDTYFDPSRLGVNKLDCPVRPG